MCLCIYIYIYIYIQCCALFRHRAYRFLLFVFILLGSLSGHFVSLFGSLWVTFWSFWQPIWRLLGSLSQKGSPRETNEKQKQNISLSPILASFYWDPLFSLFPQMSQKRCLKQLLKNKVVFKRLFKALGT